MVRAFIIMLLFKKPFLSHSPPAIENEKHAALKTNKPVNSGNKYMGRGSTLTGWRGHYGFDGLYSSGQVSMHCKLVSMTCAVVMNIFFFYIFAK